MDDKKDQILLDTLKEDASLSTYKIAKKTGIPQTTVLNRVRKLKENGLIKRYTIDVDYKKLDKKVKALIFVKVNKDAEKKRHGKVGDIEANMARYPLVLNVKRLMGNTDFVMEVIAKDVDELNQFLIKNVRTRDDVAATETTIVLDEWEK